MIAIVLRREWEVLCNVLGFRSLIHGGRTADLYVYITTCRSKILHARLSIRHLEYYREALVSAR